MGTHKRHLAGGANHKSSKWRRILSGGKSARGPTGFCGKDIAQSADEKLAQIWRDGPVSSRSRRRGWLLDKQMAGGGALGGGEDLGSAHRKARCQSSESHWLVFRQRCKLESYEQVLWFEHVDIRNLRIANIKR